MLNVVCVKWGTAPYTPEYVNILLDMMKRTTTVPFRFICYSDSTEGFSPEVELRELPPENTGWWGKLVPFREGEFPAGERVLMVDLDTLFVCRADFLLEHEPAEGEMWGLRDFYYPDQWASGIVMWRAGLWTRGIYNSWVAAGRPADYPGGDQAWVSNVLPADNLKRLQDRYPDKIVSFKAHCTDDWLPPASAVVCFHGEPRPHNCHAEWVKNVWQVSGATLPEFIMTLNSKVEERRDNVVSASARDLPWLTGLPPHNREALLVAGGPSLKCGAAFRDIRKRQKAGAAVFTVNNTHDFLAKRAIRSDGYVMLDALDKNVAFVQKPQTGCTYYIASQCAPAVFDALAGQNVVVWHADDATQDTVELLRPYADAKPIGIVGGGSTVGLRAMYLLHILGYRKIRLYGFDSCYADDGTHHAYEQKWNDGQPALRVTAGGRDFYGAPWMVKQAQEFRDVWWTLIRSGAWVEVFGDGLISWLAKHLIMEYNNATLQDKPEKETRV